MWRHGVFCAGWLLRRCVGLLRILFLWPVVDLLDDVARYGREFLAGLSVVVSTTDFATVDEGSKNFWAGCCTPRRCLLRLRGGWTGFVMVLGSSAQGCG